MSAFFTALGLLTIFPARSGAKISARAFAFYPVVGAIIGGVLVLFFYGLRAAFSNFIAAALLVILWVVLTGALHLDGLADGCDALFAATTAERRLEILRDVHLGAFGAVGLILVLMTKVAAVANVSSPAPVFLAPILGRWAMGYAAAYPLARNEGMAVMFRAGWTRGVLLAATIITAVLAAVFGELGLAAFIGAFAMATLIARLAIQRLGGLTGDIYGMTCECVEVVVLIVGTLTLAW